MLQQVNSLLNQIRRIILDLAVTLDGFIEGKNEEVDWCIMDSEMHQHSLSVSLFFSLLLISALYF